MTFSSSGTKHAAGTSLLWLSALLVALDALLGVGLAIISASFAATDPTAALNGAVGTLCVGLGVLGMALGCAVLALRLRAQAGRERYLAQHGRRARGTVLSVAPTGTGLYDNPLMKIRVRVELEGAAPYEAVFQLCIPEDAPNPPVGSVMPLRVHPADPRQVTAEEAV